MKAESLRVLPYENDVTLENLIFKSGPECPEGCPNSLFNLTPDTTDSSDRGSLEFGNL